MLIPGLNSLMRVAIVPSPQPMSNTEDCWGISLARAWASTLARLSNTVWACARFKSAKAVEECGVSTIQDESSVAPLPTFRSSPHGLKRHSVRKQHKTNYDIFTRGHFILLSARHA